MPDISKLSLTPADKIAIDKLRVPKWINRDADIKMIEVEDPSTGKMVKQPAMASPTPVTLLRKDVKRIKAFSRVRNRVKFVPKGITIEIEGGMHASGRKQRTFHKVISPGSVIVREVFNRISKKLELIIGGTAVLEPDVELTMAFDQEHWSKNDA